jgi:membrane protein implicated in regulation of membrane protease activity
MIKNSSASALTWLSAILLFVGLLMMSPSGSLAVFVLAALFAVTPAVFGRNKIRIIAVILLLVSILLAVNQYPEFQNERERISKRTKISHRDFPTNIYISSQKNTDLRQEGKCPI